VDIEFEGVPLKSVKYQGSKVLFITLEIDQQDHSLEQKTVDCQSLLYKKTLKKEEEDG